MNYATLLLRLRERVNNPSQTDVTDTKLGLRLNEAYTDIWDQHRFYANRGSTDQPTIAATGSVTLPADVDTILNVADTTNHVRLTKMDRDQYVALDQSTATGKPTRYYREGTTLYLDPVPDGIYTIRVRYKKQITELAAAGDLPAIPTSWHNGITLLARYKHFETEGNWQMAQAAWSIWQNWIDTKSDEIDDELQNDSDIHFQPHDLASSGKATDRLDFDHSDW